MYASNLWGRPLAAAQRVIHHEMVHAWQFARYLEMMQQAPTARAQQARTMWYEGHAVTYERAAHAKVPLAPTPLQRLAFTSLALDPKTDREAAASSSPDILAPRVFRTFREEGRFGAQLIERTVLKAQAWPRCS